MKNFEPKYGRLDLAGAIRSSRSRHREFRKHTRPSNQSFNREDMAKKPDLLKATKIEAVLLEGGPRRNSDPWSDRDGTGNVRLSSSSSVRKSHLFRPNRRR